MSAWSPSSFSLMTKISPFIPHDILPANIKTPLCWIQRTQMEEMVRTAQKEKGRWRELRGRREREIFTKISGFRHTHTHTHTYTHTHKCIETSQQAQYKNTRVMKRWQWLMQTFFSVQFKVCRCKHYAHSQHQKVNESIWEHYKELQKLWGDLQYAGLTFRPSCPVSPTGPIIPESPYNTKRECQKVQMQQWLISRIINVLRARQTRGCYKLMYRVRKGGTHYLLSFRCWPRWGARVSFSPLMKRKAQRRTLYGWKLP